MCGAPVVLNMVTSSTSLTNQPLEKPVQFLAAGAPVLTPLLLRSESLGFRVTHCYGLTETAGFIVLCSWKPPWDALMRQRQGVRTIGVMDMDVVDPERETRVEKDGSSLGEIVIKGGQVMLGYLKDPTATSSCMRGDDWFYTGDAGVVHPEGYLEIKDRSKDVIISGRENISSAEVEFILYSNPAVKEATVVARPDEFWGDTLCLLGFKEELPRTSTGKIKKFVLREIAKALG
ncbi:putative acyl-activating enzyme 9 [Hibiscus syriacus]|uniref:Acyl-activating enzyme 9 n=1 Tax=Hibiscus syriacus TaxID=106335 RepID=A0A6A3ABB0_HIBSY|nr:putative acyl-activating enzyme 9 [Hibiscus syriacus]